MNIKEKARPIGFLMCVFTLCLLFILEILGYGKAPVEAVRILGGIAGAWLVAREIRKGKGGN